MTVSPDSTRPPTRRALRERDRRRSGADGDPGTDAETPTDAASPDASAGGTTAATAVLDGEVADTGIEDAAAVDLIAEAEAVAEAEAITGSEAAATDEDAVPETAFLHTETDPVATTRSAIVDEAMPETEFLAASTASALVAPTAAPQPAPAEWADEKRPPTALTWIDARDVAAASVPAAVDEASTPDIMAGARLLPGWLRPRVLTPLGLVVALCGGYVATTLLWPLHAVAPEITAVQVEVPSAPAAAVTWPTTGSAAVGVQGLPTAASTTSADEIASISKVASVLMVLDELPLKPGEQGPSFEFDNGDAREYWQYRRSNQSALDVPVGRSLTEYQMLQGVLLGSANNYIDRLSDELWGGERGFAEASRAWLSERGITGITLESPSGFDERNVATPAALVELGELAMRNPVFAEIVGTRSAEIPGAGTVTNTNGMLEDAGVIGVKTGTLSHWNLLTAKDVPVGDTTVRLFASVLGQDDNDARLAVTRGLFAEVEKALAEQPAAVPAGTVVGRVTTEWGGEIDVVTDSDARVVLWNGATATASAEFSLGEKTAKGANVGNLTAQGPLDADETAVSLAKEIPAPSIWWRLTHPLELFGLDKN